jgi:hypothetical protein
MCCGLLPSTHGVRQQSVLKAPHEEVRAVHCAPLISVQYTAHRTHLDLCSLSPEGSTHLLPRRSVIMSSHSPLSLAAPLSSAAFCSARRSPMNSCTCQPELCTCATSQGPASLPITLRLEDGSAGQRMHAASGHTDLRTSHSPPAVVSHAWNA